MLSPEPGETLDVLMRERWFGATGRKVPQIALEGTVDLEGALVLDDVSDLASDPGGARSRASPSSSARLRSEEVHAALSLGEVACALVTDASLLELDLAQLTYG